MTIACDLENFSKQFALHKQRKENNAYDSIDLFVLQKQYNLENGKYGKVCVYKHEPTQKEFLVKYLTLKSFKPIEPLVHNLMKDDKHFINLYHYYFDTKNAVLVMDFIKKGDLFDYIRQQPRLKDKEVKLIIRQLGEALNALHKHNIIHNDVKLENVLYNNNLKRVYICDYGLCSRVGTKSRLENGTLDYFSPEKIKELDHQLHFDWWAIGILTFELYTKQNHPFKRNLSEELTIEKLEQRQSKPIKFPSYINEEAKSFINSLLTYNISHRLMDYEKIKTNTYLK
ncbi:protein kinase 1 [Apocheima cinerarium nucleopolyhedrovirus]|uniref:protein kinase 1 n=1 Tax=Apocheima cinerarium nucleopolyhedrovirus TaxID=307461 RepID=UPI0001D920D9|nr:protein kinase 1 [Apocheima cinerarium nucleopolyhedrovirus]ADB84478.1 protein kinase 1 [Apocheima cinerarium nucleopolyhedrovirus]